MDIPHAEPMLEYIRRRLDASRGQWPDISRESGVPYFTISKLMTGKSRHPRIDTCQALHDTLRRREVDNSPEAA